MRYLHAHQTGVMHRPMLRGEYALLIVQQYLGWRFFSMQPEELTRQTIAHQTTLAALLMLYEISYLR